MTRAQLTLKRLSFEMDVITFSKCVCFFNCREKQTIASRVIWSNFIAPKNIFTEKKENAQIVVKLTTRNVKKGRSTTHKKLDNYNAVNSFEFSSLFPVKIHAIIRTLSVCNVHTWKSFAFADDYTIWENYAITYRVIWKNNNIYTYV
jgi:hypothetical protein